MAHYFICLPIQAHYLNMANITQQVSQSLIEQLNRIKEQTQTLFKGIEEKGITTKTGEVLLPAGAFKLDETALNLTEIPKDTIGFENIKNQAITNLASATSLDEFLKAQQQLFLEQQKSLTGAKEAQAGFLERFKTFFTGKEGQEEQLKSLMGEFQIPETQAQIRVLIPEIGALNQELANLRTAEMAETTRILDNPQYSVQYASREANRVSREYAIRQSGISAELGIKTSLLEAFRGNIESARNLIGDIVSAIQYDERMKLAELNFFYEANQDFINKLETEEKNILNEIRSYWQNKVEKEEKELSDKINLGIRAVENSVNLGLTSVDYQRMSLAEVMEVYQNKVGQLGGKIKPEEKIKIPTIFGLTEGQTRDVLFSPAAPDWFIRGISEQYQMTPTPDFINPLWEEYKKGVIEKHQEVKKLISPPPASGFQSWMEEWE